MSYLQSFGAKKIQEHGIYRMDPSSCEVHQYGNRYCTAALIKFKPVAADSQNKRDTRKAPVNSVGLNFSVVVFAVRALGEESGGEGALPRACSLQAGWLYNCLKPFGKRIERNKSFPSSNFSPFSTGCAGAQSLSTLTFLLSLELQLWRAPQRPLLVELQGGICKI
ncbi:hypothetical protein EK904_002395 [Melospiza melodia maxima]|nr:hypothetical protein EK904_002395 [Melospiza melodia maxima]